MNNDEIVSINEDNVIKVFAHDGNGGYKYVGQLKQTGNSIKFTLTEKTGVFHAHLLRKLYEHGFKLRGVDLGG